LLLMYKNCIALHCIALHCIALTGTIKRNTCYGRIQIYVESQTSALVQNLIANPTARGGLFRRFGKDKIQLSY
jgi:hypothetical protein